MLKRRCSGAEGKTSAELHLLLENKRSDASNRQALTTVKQQLEAANAKVAQHVKRIQELKNALSENERARSLAEKRADRFQKQLHDAKEKLRGLKLKRKSTDGNPTRTRIEKEEIQNNALSITEVLLQEQLLEAKQETERIAKSLEDETRTNEEQRVFIDVLQSALKSKAEDLGLGGLDQGKSSQNGTTSFCSVIEFAQA